jgi:Flp pilus assembly protein TadG
VTGILRVTRERGAAAVEFAILFPLMLLVIAAIVDFGRAFFYQIQLTNAAREGARAAVVSDVSDADLMLRVQSSVPAIDPADLTYVTLIRCPGSDSTVNSAVELQIDFQWVFMGAAFAVAGDTWLGDPNLSARAEMQCGG